MIITASCYRFLVHSSAILNIASFLWTAKSFKNFSVFKEFARVKKITKRATGFFSRPSRRIHLRTFVMKEKEACIKTVSIHQLGNRLYDVKGDTNCTRVRLKFSMVPSFLLCFLLFLWLWESGRKSWWERRLCYVLRTRIVDELTKAT